MYDIICGLGVLAVFGPVFYYLFWLGKNDRAYNKMSTYRERYETLANRHGLTLKQIAGCRDDAPCNVEFLLISDDVYVRGYSNKIKKIIAGLAKGTIKVQDLKERSVWPQCKIPEV
jgi:hypothetical protein